MTNINPRLKALADRLKTDLPSENVPIIDEVKEPESEMLTFVPSNINPREYIKIPGTSILIARQETLKGFKREKTYYELAKKGLFMPNSAIFMPYFLKVQEASLGKINLYDGNGTVIDRNESEDLWKYLTTGLRGECWTWLDDLFKEDANGWKLETDHRIVNGKLTSKTYNLESCLRKDAYVSLEFNRQGIPTPTSESGYQKYKQGKNIYFRHPRDGTVARFIAGSGRADLGCGGNPSFSSASLGVFACAEGATRAKKISRVKHGR